MSSPNDTGAHPVPAGCVIPECNFWFLKAIHSGVLVAATHGTIDLNQLARAELIRRGLDPSGGWVGCRRARELHANFSIRENAP